MAGPCSLGANVDVPHATLATVDADTDADAVGLVDDRSVVDTDTGCGSVTARQ